MLIQLDHVKKEYEDFTLELDMHIPENRVIGLIGANGAGKSTAFKLMLGLIRPDYGTVNVLDRKASDLTVMEKEKIGTVFSDSGFSEYLTVQQVIHIMKNFYTDFNENLFQKQCEKLEIPLKKQIKEFSTGMKAKLKVILAISHDSKLLILDEPTASLNEDDSKALLDLLLKFKKQGMTSIIISHKLNEISYVADKITVIRDGSTIETLDKKKDDFSEQRIIQGMVGREMTDRFPRRPDVKIGDVSMEVKNWTVYHPLYSERKVVDNVSFKIHKGEVVGISGLMGAGRTELAMSIFGKSYGTKISGQIFMNGKEVKLNTVQEAIDNKLAYVTEDRKGNGLILSKSIKMNTSLANMKGISNGQVIDADKEYAVAEEYRKKLKTKCPSVEQNVGNLSGGNQQKVLLAKWMFAEPDILILDEPTRGIDVGAKYEIYCIINDLVAAGKSVIMISSELPEVLGMSDRIYIMNEGKFVGEVSKEEATSELIMSKIVKSGKGA